MIPPYQQDEAEFDVHELSKRKRTRRSKLDTRSPADFVSEGERVKAAAFYWLVRQQKGRIPSYKLMQEFLFANRISGLFERLPLRPAVIYSVYRALYPGPCEVAACCWTVKASSTYRFAFLSHLNSAAHLAQHFRVDTRDVIHEARALKVAMALANDEDEA